MEKAMFAAGCFWQVEEEFRRIPGVIDVSSGYSGGHTPEPTYGDVCSGATGHAEVVEVEFDPEQVPYGTLVERFWEIHDPTTPNRQGPDVGTQYRSAIFVHSPEQEAAARDSLERARPRFRKPIVTEVTPASEYHRAEEYHQRYLERRGLVHG
ncbi:MAG: peptide-methionine (S)-S-oxide reductase MsrA [Thermoleophilaceae bacterium]